MPEIKRIMKHRNVKKAAALKHEINSAARKKQDNRKRHSREEDSAIVPERKRAVIKELV